MVTSRATRRGWSMLLTLLLPFVLVFSTPTHAFAASGVETVDTYWSNLMFDLEAAMEVNPQCRFPIRYDGPEAMVWGAGECDGGYDTTPSYTQIPEPGTPFEVEVNGVGTGGGPCSSAPAGGTLAAHPQDGWNIWAVIPAGSLQLPNQCQVVEVCLSLRSTGWGNDTTLSECVPFDALPVAPDLADCDHGWPASLTYNGQPYQYNWTGEGLGRNRMQITLDLDKKTSNAWAGVAVIRHPQTGLFKVNFTVQDGVAATIYESSGLYMSQTRPLVLVGVQLTPQVPDLYAGVEGYAHLGPSTNSVHAQLTMTGVGYTQAKDLWVFPQEDTNAKETSPHGILGTTDTRVCSFWVGETAATAPRAIINDPTGNLSQSAPYMGIGEGPPPVEYPEPPVVIHDDNNPADEGNFWAEALALLAGIAAAVWALPQLFVAGMDALFNKLFVPSEGYMNAKAASLRASWEATAPFQWWGAFSGLDIGTGATGCEGIAFKPPIPGAEAMETTYIGAACSGQMATIAGMFRLVTSAVVVIYGGWSCVRVLLGGFGIRPEFNPDGSVMQKAMD